MNRIALLVAAGALIFAAWFGYLGRAVKAARADEQSSTAAETRAIATATTAFLNTLSPDQRQKVLYSFAPQKTAVAAKFARTGGPSGPGGGSGMHPRLSGQPASNHPGDGGGPGKSPGSGPGMGPFGGFVGEQYGKAVWSNYPVSDVPRPGLRLGDLGATQRGAVMHLLQVALSAKGYQKVLDIMGSDQALHESGTPFCSGADCYTIGIFGEPSTTKPWMLEFGGHHLGLNITMAGQHGVITPTLTGAQPAVYTRNGKTVRALAEENDKASALLNALGENQRKQAILNYEIGDLVLGPGRAGMTIQPEGLKASAMNGEQQALLLDIIAEWAGIVNDAYAKPRMEEIKIGLNDTYFAWSGPITHEPGRNGSAYYRIQGPELVIEFSPQGVGGDSTMHVHTMYRDPTNDYGIQFNGAE
jgi:Protein of unknown function (DUF3500)